MPATPGRFRYTNVQRTFITFDWDPVPGVTGYKIYVNNSFLQATSSTVYTVSGLQGGNNYDVSVTSFDEFSESVPSTLPGIRTGLYPDMKLPEIDASYTVAPIPADTTPYTNVYGLLERKVSQRSVLGDVSELEKPYSKIPLWNKDESELRSELPREFYDGTTYALKADRTVSNIWGYYDDNRSIRNFTNTFEIRNEAGTITFARTFSEYDAISIAPTDETLPSWDGDRFAFQGERGGQMYLFTYEMSTDTKFGEVAINDVANGWTAASPYGTYAVVLIQNGSIENQLRVYDFETLTFIGASTDTDQIGHCALQVSIQGNEVMAGRIAGRLGMWKLSAPQTTHYLFGQPGTSDYFQLGHASGVNFYQPGWLFFEDRNLDSFGSVTWETGKRLYRKVQAVCLDENRSGYLQVLTRTYGRIYAIETHQFSSTPNPTGEKVGFNNYSNDAAYTYLEFYVAQRTTGEDTTPPVNTGIININVPNVTLDTKRPFMTAVGYGAQWSIPSTFTIRKVTNLSDSGAGSFRSAVTTSAGGGFVIVLFEVAGTIISESNMTAIPNIYIAGETAFRYGGGGITITERGASASTDNATLLLQSNSIIRFVRVRKGRHPLANGGTPPCCGDGLGAYGETNVIADHVEVSHTYDEAVSFALGSSNVTFQNSMIHEPLWNDAELDYGKGYKGGQNFTTWYRSFISNSYQRNPTLGPYAEGGATGQHEYEYINNVAMNLGSFGLNMPMIDIGAFEMYTNIIGNYWQQSPVQGGSRRDVMLDDRFPQANFYVSDDNYHSEDRPIGSTNDVWDNMVTVTDGFAQNPSFSLPPDESVRSLVPFNSPILLNNEKVVNGAQVADEVLPTVGCYKWRDEVSQRQINDFYSNSDNYSPGSFDEADFGALFSNPPAMGTLEEEYLVPGIPNSFVIPYNIQSRTQVITNWDFGTFTFTNNAGYTAMEVYLAWISGDLEYLAGEAPVVAPPQPPTGDEEVRYKKNFGATNIGML